MESKDIRELNKLYMEAVYGGGKKEEKKDTRLVVTNADKKANTPAWQKYKAGSTAYKAADHVKEGKDESPEEEEEKDKEDDDLAGSPNKKGKKKAKRWWDDDGDGKGYEDGEVDGKFKKKKKDVKEAVVQTYGTKGKLKKELKDLGKGAETLKGKNIAKADKVAEEVLDEKESYKTVAAVIDYDRSKKGTDDATYDSLHGKKKAAKKERDYAAWEREKMKKDDPNWKHKKGSTSESVEIESLINSGVFSEEEIAKIVEVDRLGKLEEGEKLAQKAYKRAQELGAKRRRSKDPSGIYKSERAGYNLAQSQRSDNESPATQRGNQTGGGPKDFGFAKHKKNPVKSKSVGDTGSIGHARKAQEKTSVGKSGKKLKTPKYKLSFQQRRDHHSDWSKRQELKDPKKNPKHEANK